MMVMVMIIIIFTVVMMIRRQHCCVNNGLMLVLPLLTLSFTCCVLAGVMTCFRRLDRIQTA